MIATHAQHTHFERLRPTLLRFAYLQLRNDALAENVVQEVLATVLDNAHRLAISPSKHTDITDIMKRKLIDLMRASGATPQYHRQDQQHEENVIDLLFRENGHTIERTRAWSDPETTLKQQDFFATMEFCLERLPADVAQIFMMREWLELEIDDICTKLNITTTHATTMLYRARIRLRECLDLRWFGDQPLAQDD